MNQREVLKYIGMSVDELEQRADAAMGSVSTADLHKHYEESVKDFEIDTILKGRVLNIVNDDVIVDVGYKSEGIVSIQEFWNPQSVKPGDEIEVFLEGVEDEAGLIAISKAKADRIRGWERIITSNKEGDVVRGRVIRKIKGSGR